MTKTALLVFFFLFFYPQGTLAAEKKLVFLGNIEFTPIKGYSPDDFELRLFIKEKTGLLKHLTEERSYHIINKSEYLAIKSRHYSFPGKTGYSKVEPSFIIDFDIELFKPIRNEIIEKYGKKPEPEDLVRYVNHYIKDKNFNRGFDIASVIARKKEGDCTEHAILLVSIMRMFKIPAKMAMGIKVFTEKGVTRAFGHAWVEYIFNGKWKGADPSLLTEVDHSYIPMGTLDREGLDYAMGMVTLFNRMPYRLEGSGM
ncbi:MAG: transglutaminase-like domain-containing protein [Deltaproteobacteria bacterium]|nr:transglutaminase-like domain-containing protein [Deltaproteobacteria bacterium]